MKKIKIVKANKLHQNETYEPKHVLIGHSVYPVGVLEKEQTNTKDIPRGSHTLQWFATF